VPRQYNKGGLLVNWHGLDGFIPASQLHDFPNQHILSERMEEMKRRVNRPICVRIIEVNPQKRRLILSERAALVQPEERQSLLQTISPGEVRTGTVTNLASFGAFVDLGGVEGLIHISELSWSRLRHPDEVVAPGQELTCRVLETDATTGRVALSLKQMQPDPWSDVESRYKSGDIVTGVVSQVEPYGIFITLEPGLEALLHVSELPEALSGNRDLAVAGQYMAARILSVSGEMRRISLSLREAWTENGA
jgi:small subunit ribosomal protein S1